MNGTCAAAAMCDLAEQLDVGRRLIEVVVADEAAERLAAESPVLRLVDLLEQRALVPRRPHTIGLIDQIAANAMPTIGLESEAESLRARVEEAAGGQPLI